MFLNFDLSTASRHYSSLQLKNRPLFESCEYHSVAVSTIIYKMGNMAMIWLFDMDSSMIIYYDSYPLGIEQFALENHNVNWVNHRTKCTMASQFFLTIDRRIRIDIATGDDISKPITISLLLGGIPTPLKNMSSSMGRMTSHIFLKIKKNETTNISVVFGPFVFCTGAAD